ncbi:MAG: hypothetical protein EOP58_00460 [Sphingomonadales bacterium]|nr:MAG: hypothetical protein EOP58_00460 [Sphingomonadales bacterium]
MLTQQRHQLEAAAIDRADIEDRRREAVLTDCGARRAHALHAKMADAWIRFAHTGDPNHPDMARWTPYSAAAPATMLFDDKARQAMDAADLASPA